MLFRQPSSAHIDLALLVLRLVLGIVLIAHGGQKLFTYGLAGVTGAMAQAGAPLPSLLAPLVIIAEFLGGAAILAGFLTRIAALGNAVVQVGAIALVHARHGFFAPEGLEFNLTLLAVALALVIAGAGRYSLDARLGARTGPLAGPGEPVA